MNEPEQVTDEMGESTPEVASRPPGFLDSLYRVLFAPWTAFRPPAVPISYGLAVILLVTALSAARMAVVDLPVYAELGLGAAIAFAVAQLLIAGLGWLLLGAFVALMMELMGGQGRIRDLLAWQGLAAAPRLFETPLTLALRTVPGFQWLPGFILGLWSLVLFIAAARATYRVSAASAFVGIVLMPVVVVAILVTGFVVVGLLAGLSFGIPDFRQFWP